MVRINLLENGRRNTRILAKKSASKPVILALLLASFILISMIAGKAFAISNQEFTGKSTSTKKILNGREAKLKFDELFAEITNHPDEVELVASSRDILDLRKDDTECSLQQYKDDKRPIYSCTETTENP